MFLKFKAVKQRINLFSLHVFDFSKWNLNFVVNFTFVTPEDRYNRNKCK